MFSEIGPFAVQDDMKTLVYRNTTWNTDMSLLFFDNPVGAGFSYTGKGTGYAKNEDDVSRDLVGWDGMVVLSRPPFSPTDCSDRTCVYFFTHR